MAVGYRAVFRVDPANDAIQLADDVLHDWLKSKRPRRQRRDDVSWTVQGIHKVSGSVELHVTHSDHEQDGSRRRLYRLIESNPAGRFTVSIFAASLPSARPHPQTLVVEVQKDEVDRDSAIDAISPPRLVRSLLDTALIRNGTTLLSGTPIVIRPGDERLVLDAITDPERTVSVYVAASPSRDRDANWRNIVERLTKESAGVAVAFSVCADAVESLNSLLPESHRVQVGNVRTFMPRVNLESPADALRHKWIGPATMARSIRNGRVSDGMQRRHARVARRRFVEMDLPADVRRTIDLLRRAETSVERAERVATILRDKPVPLTAPLPTVEVAKNRAVESAPLTPWYERGRSLIKRWLGIDDATPGHFVGLNDFIVTKTTELTVAEQQLDEAANTEQELRVELGELHKRFEDNALDLAQAEEELQEARREASILRRRLAQSEQPEAAHVEPDDEAWEAPNTLEELIGRLKSQDCPATRVEFTGSESAALEIDKRDALGMYAKMFWRYIRVLHEYAEACADGTFSGSVHTYLADGRGQGVTPTRHAARESDSVLNNAKWRAERVFPVPTDVHESGRILMDAHFKPTHRDTFAPRMHYYDDTAGTGKIYVGYIGRHLTNTLT
ncbi:hypothetical protein GCM10027064_00320 [Microbacterium petrolearium]